MDDNLFGKIIAAVLIISAIIFDWPRALAGAVAGYGSRRMGYLYVRIPIIAVVVSALGEAIYALIGRTGGITWDGFILGCLVAGFAALGLTRMLSWLINDVEAP